MINITVNARTCESKQNLQNSFIVYIEKYEACGRLSLEAESDSPLLLLSISKLCGFVGSITWRLSGASVSHRVLTVFNSSVSPALSPELLIAERRPRSGLL
jgi:hypothetical protein